MNNNQKTWIKQSSNFMYQPIMKKLRRLENGADCVIIFLKLQSLFAEFEDFKINYNDCDESFASQLSDLIDEDIENIQSTLDLLIKQRIIISQNNNIFSWVDFQDSKIIKENSRTEYFREHKRRSRAKSKSTKCGQNVDKVWTRCGQSVDSPQYVHNMSTTHSQSEPAQPSDARAKTEKETAQNEQVSTNTRTCARACLDINNNYNKDLSNKDLNIKLKDKQDINNKYLELENKDLNTKSLNNKNLKTKKLNNKNLKPKESLTVSKDSNNSSVDLQAITKQVIEHINCVSHANYRNLKQYRDLIQECLNDGYTPQDFITAIDKKTADLASSPDRKFWLNRCIKPTWILKPENLDQCLNLRIAPKVDKATYDCLKRRSDVRKVLDNIDVQFDPDDDNKRDIVDDFDNFFDIKFDEERVCA